MQYASQTPDTGLQGPVRTCVGCRQRDSRSVLVRIVAQGSVAVMDPRGTAAGRGAWLHPDPTCVDQARRRHSLARALRVPDLDTSNIEFAGA